MNADDSPRADDAEADLLCVVFASRGRVLDELDLSPAEFFRPAHEVIFALAREMHTIGAPVEATVVADHLDAAGDLARVGGRTYIDELVARLAAIASAGYYSRIIRRAASRRKIVETGTRLQVMGATPTEDIGEVVEAARSEIERLAERISGAAEHDLQDDLDAAIEAIEHGTSSMPTGWPDLDHLIGGWRKGAVYVVAARPGGGKSIFGEQAVIHAMTEHGVPGAFQSIEMGRTEIHLRAFAQLGEVNLANLMRGQNSLGKDEWDRVSKARGIMGDTRFEVDDRSAPTVADIRATVARCKRRHGSCGLLVIDYLQLLSTAGRSENRQTEVAGISRAIKVMAKDLEIPILVLAQLNRGPEGEKRPPRPSDLRESGAVEQDADVVILLHRDAEADPGTLFVGIGKNRHGPTGSLKLKWEGHYSRLLDSGWTNDRADPNYYNNQSAA